MPCISTVTPYQTWYLARHPAPSPASRTPYRWTWHFYWGLEDIIEVFADMWGQVENNRVIGGLWPDDGDGRAWGSRFPAVLRNQGYRIVDLGRYQRREGQLRARDRAVQGRGGRHRHRGAAARRLRHLLEAGGRAGLPAQDRLGRQGPAVPGVLRGHGHRRRRLHRGRLEPPAPVHLLADRGQRRPAGQRLPGGHGQAVDPAARLRARPVRGRRLGGQAGRRPRRPPGHGRRHQGDPDGHRRRPGRLDRGPGRGPQRLADPAGRWPVAPGPSWPFELEIVSNTVHPEIPATGTLQPVADLEER